MNKKSELKQRKRGRPVGKDRLPLSQEERRARNAQYERERRIEHAQAVTELVNASGFDPGLSFENLLRHVCCYFQKESRRSTDDSVESLRQINSDLLQQIEQAEATLAAPTPPQSPTDEEDTCMRTRPFNYIRKVKKEMVSIESSEITSQPNTGILIKTKIDKTENDRPTQTTEQPACAPVQIKTEVCSETIPHQGIVKKTRPQKKRKVDHNTAVAVHFEANPAPAHVDSAPEAQCSRLAKADKDLKAQEKEERRPQKTQLETDPFILGLFTEEQAKYEIVQYYINLLKEEGYNGGAATSTDDQTTPIEQSRQGLYSIPNNASRLIYEG